jgi:hypothetical protein
MATWTAACRTATPPRHGRLGAGGHAAPGGPLRHPLRPRNGHVVLAQLWAGKPPPPPELTVGVVCLPKPGRGGLRRLLGGGSQGGALLCRRGRRAGPWAGRGTGLARGGGVLPGAGLAHGGGAAARHGPRSCAAPGAPRCPSPRWTGPSCTTPAWATISSGVVSPGGVQRMVSMNGTLGHQTHRMQQFSYRGTRGAPGDVLGRAVHPVEGGPLSRAPLAPPQRGGGRAVPGLRPGQG